MIHDAASRLRCASVQESCYQPTHPDQPRPCPAKEKDKRGCDCDTPACAQMCHFTTPRDRAARFIYYTGSNHSSHNPKQATDPAQAQKKRGQARYGYRSLPLQLVDPQCRFSLILLDDFRSANEREENPTAALLQQLPPFYQDLQLDTVAGDAAFGYDITLSTLYNLGVRRCIDLRSHPTDQDKANWPKPQLCLLASFQPAYSTPKSVTNPTSAPFPSSYISFLASNPQFYSQLAFFTESSYNGIALQGGRAKWTTLTEQLSSLFNYSSRSLFAAAVLFLGDWESASSAVQSPPRSDCPPPLRITRAPLEPYLSR